MPRVLIAKSSLSGSSPTLLNNKAVVAWYTPIREELKKTTALQDFLAEPVTKRAEDPIEWYSTLVGEPVNVKYLPPEERELALGRIAGLTAQYRNLAEMLRASPVFQTRQLGIFMLEALAHPEALEYFYADGAVTVAMWGHGRAVSTYLPPPPPGMEVPDLPVTEEPVEALPPPPPVPRGPRISIKKIFLLLATGLITGLFGLFLLTFAFVPHVLFSLNYVFNKPTIDWVAVGKNQGILNAAQADLFQAMQRYLKGRSHCLIVPASGGDDLKFLEGCWKIPDTEFINSQNGGAAQLSFCHQGDKTEIKIADKSAQTGECKASATAIQSSGGLQLEADSELDCGSGQSYPPLSIICEQGKIAGAAANCRVTEKDWKGGYFQEVPIVPQR
jgi:hypothetical protein